jgi:enoyl-CoA hydratase/carnithine racemase
MASLPESYEKLNFSTLLISHHPPSSPSPTPVIIIKLNRPSQRNGFTDTMADDLVAVFNTLSLDSRVKAVVITSSDPQNKMYCAGMDFTAPQGVSTTAELHRDGGGRVSLAMYRCSKPVIAAINGHAVGVGITMTLPANIRIASTDAKIGFVFGRRGFCLEACSSFFLPRLVGASKALHLTSTGAVYPATHKLFDGLFSEVVPPEEVLPTALRVAEDISVNVSGVSSRVMKDLIFRQTSSPEEAHLLESRIFHGLFRGKDAKEGVDSFLEKRQPDFRGSLEDGLAYYPWWTPVDVKPPAKL